MYKNQANQQISVIMIDKSTGDGITGESANITVKVKVDSGSVDTGDGSISEISDGVYLYAPTQAETNGDHITFIATHANAVSFLVNIYTADLSVARAANLTQIDGEANADATLNLKKLNIVNVGDSAVHIEASDAIAFKALSTGATGNAFNIESRTVNSALAIQSNNSPVGTSSTHAINIQGYGNGIQIGGGVTSGVGNGIGIGGGSTSGSGIAISTVNGHGVTVIGSGANHAINLTNNGTGRCILAQSTNTPVLFQATGSNVYGMSLIGGTGSTGGGMSIAASSAGRGLVIQGGATANALEITGGSTSGNGVNITTTNGRGVSITGTGSNAGIFVEAGNANAIRAISTGNATNAVSFSATGTGIGHGLNLEGGANGSGLNTVGAGTGHGISASATTGNGLLITSSGNHGALINTSANNFNGCYLRGTTGTNSVGLSIQGYGTSSAVSLVGGSTGNGITITGGATSGSCITMSNTSGSQFVINSNTSNNPAVIINGNSGGTNGRAVYLLSPVGGGSALTAQTLNDSSSVAFVAGNGIGLRVDGTTFGVSLNGGITGSALRVAGGSTSGNAINVITTDGHGIDIDSNGSGKYDINADISINQINRTSIESDVADNVNQFFNVDPTTTKTVDDVGGGGGGSSLTSQILLIRPI